MVAPILRMKASIGAFSARTSPMISVIPVLLAQSIRSCIRRRARPLPFIAASTTMANSPCDVPASWISRATPTGLPGRFAHRDEGHLALVVDLGHAGDLLGWKLAQDVEEAIADVLGAEPAEQGGVGLGVLRTDRADQQGLWRAGAALCGEGPGQLLRVGGDGKLCVLAGRAQADPGVGGGHAFGVGKQRVDIDGRDLRMIEHELADADQRVRDRVLIGGGLVP